MYVNQSVCQSINSLSFNQPIWHMISLPVNESASQSINRSVSQSNILSVNPSVRRSTSQSVNLSECKSINRSVSQPNSLSVSHSIREAYSQSAGQPISLSVNQRVCKSINEFVSQSRCITHQKRYNLYIYMCILSMHMFLIHQNTISLIFRYLVPLSTHAISFNSIMYSDVFHYNIAIRSQL